MGYVRVMKPNTKTFIKALVDSGNLFGDIISEKLAKILKLKVKPCEKKAGTAMAGQAVKVIGISEPFQLLIENLSEPVTITPYIVAGLSHDLNLGEAFLRREQAQLTFEGMTVTLNIKNQGIELVPKNTPLIRNSNDLRFIQVMEDDKLKRDNLFSENNELSKIFEIQDENYSAYSFERTEIPANSIGQIKVKSKMLGNIGLFKDKHNSKFLNRNKILK